METLKEIIREIETCDDQIIDALTRRMRNIEKIIQYKKELHLPVIAPGEEREQQRKLEEKLMHHPFREELDDIFSSINMSSQIVQAKVLFPRNIVLIGFMGAGKSSVAAYLAETLSMETIETDQEIVDREGCSISEIFERFGESYFRDRESEVIREVGEGQQMVISAGGGAVLRDENVENMKANGVIVLLTATPSAILERVRDNADRPLLNGNMNEEYISAMMEKRRARYEEVADCIIDTTGKTIPEVCEAIIAAVG